MQSFAKECSADLGNMSFKVEEGVRELTECVTHRTEQMLLECKALADPSGVDGSLLGTRIKAHCCSHTMGSSPYLLDR